MPNHIKLKNIIRKYVVTEAEEYITGASGESHWGGKDGAAGCIVFARDTGRFLFGFRSREVDNSHLWSTFGGAIHPGMNPSKVAQMELTEETGYRGPISMRFLYLYKDGDFRYYNYLGIVDNEFKPHLNWENDNAAWVKYGNWPDPLHPGTAQALANSISRIKQIYSVNYKLEEAIDTPPPIVKHEPAPAQKGVATPAHLKNAYVVAATVWGEARGEGTNGMQAVLNVIMNRAKGNFTNAASVSLRPKQFSIWNNIKDPYTYSTQLAQKARDGKLKDKKQYDQALAMVDLAMRGKLKDITGGALFYFNPKLANPSWAKKLRFIKKIGNHDFYGIKPTPKSTKSKTR